MPFARGMLFFEKQRSNPGVVAIAEIPGIILAFDSSIKVGGANEAFFDGRDGDVGGLKRADGLETKLPGEEMIAERLFLVAAVAGELQESFAFEEFCDLRDWRTEVREVRPAGESDDEAREFADQMIIGGGTERFVAPRIPGVGREDLRAEFVQRFLRDASGGEKSINPGVIDEANADFEAAGPVHAGERRIGAAPIVQPLDAFILRGFVVIEPGGQRETDELKPAARFPNDFNVGAVRMRPMIHLEGDLAGSEV